MATFLTTIDTSSEIERLILNAKSKLVLVTPYLKMSRLLHERIQDANKNGISITLIYGKCELQPEQWEKLSNLENVRIYFCDNLHAKCYHNGEQMIISSMNLFIIGPPPRTGL